MALHGRFYLNYGFFSPLKFPGIGTFMAFSGDKGYRNIPGCTHIPDLGALPPGRYWIVDRPEGGIRSKVTTLVKNIASGVRHQDWFALYRDDGKIDDHTFIRGMERGNFRLHPIGRAGLSQGCITMQHGEDFYRLRAALLRTSKIRIPQSKTDAYGTIEVILSDEKNCAHP
ncbi:DUF2778 domain-containing protein [Erwinia mallotivora]|uniref:DUF2778 domain-containing protein n=1 Tax=Erwinia mallotivora TaxID=69222 RepID=UPI0035EF5C4C